MPLQHMTVEDIVTKGEIAHSEQFLLLPRCSSTLFSYYNLFEKFNILVRKFATSTAVEFLYVGKGLKRLLRKKNGNMEVCID